ncbi:hypothetical protein B0O80DRAFT_423821 [Mortierella sp. GBAus27b]|nr:hypothetical protein B0O80DRAFT_423821 [Mortierella sp. GBAus27b]
MTQLCSPMDLQSATKPLVLLKRPYSIHCRRVGIFVFDPPQMQELLRGACMKGCPIKSCSLCQLVFLAWGGLLCVLVESVLVVQLHLWSHYSAERSGEREHTAMEKRKDGLDMRPLVFAWGLTHYCDARALTSLSRMSVFVLGPIDHTKSVLPIRVLVLLWSETMTRPCDTVGDLGWEEDEKPVRV